MQFLVRKAFEFKTLTTMLMVIVVGCSWVCFKNMNTSLLPEVILPRVSVTVNYNGSNKSDINTLIASPLERSFVVLEGVRSVRAVVSSGGVRFMVSFHENVALQDALDRVNASVDARMQDLPKDCPRPIISPDEGNYQKVAILRVSGIASPNALLRFGRHLQKQIEQIKGVYNVDMWGHRAEQVCVEVDPLALANLHLSPEDVVNRIVAANVPFSDVSLPSATGPILIHTKGSLKDAKDISLIPIATSEGHVLAVKDIATVYKRARPSLHQNRFQGQDSLILNVFKRHGADTFFIMKRVGWAIDDFNDLQSCASVSCDVLYDSAPVIQSRLDGLYNSLAMAIALVVVLVSLSFGLRSTSLVGLTIPVTFLVALGVLQLLGLTLNMIVLFGLIGAVGVLVDGAIIVNECADGSLRAGKTPGEAYREAASRMAWPAFTSVLTIVLSFIPLMFWPGVTGQYMRHLPLTFIVTLSASIICALVFMPVLGASLPQFPWKKTMRKELWTFQGVMRWYEKKLHFTIKNSVFSGLSIAGVAVAAIIVFLVRQKGFEFFPEIEPNSGRVVIATDEALTFEQQQKIADEVEGIIRTNKHLDNVWTSVGTTPDDQNTIGSVMFTFIDWRERPAVSQVLKDIRKTLPEKVGYNCEVVGASETPLGKVVEVEFSSYNQEDALNFANKMANFIRNLDGTESVSVNTPSMNFHWHVDLKRDVMLECGVSANNIRHYLQLLGEGTVITRYVPHDLDMQVDIILTTPEKMRTWNYFHNLPVKNSSGEFSALGVFCEKKPALRSPYLLRYNGAYGYSARFFIKEGFFMEQIEPHIQEWAKSNKPASVNYAIAGAVHEKQTNVNFMLFAFVGSLVLIGMILLMQFNNIFQVLVVLSSVVFSTIGGLFGIALMGLNFGLVMNGIGLVALNGIIVSNNVILLDTYNLLVAQGKEHMQALIEACVSRIRPIFLTQITTVLGLVPMMFRVEIQPLSWLVDVGSPESGWWEHISTTIVCGVLFATPFTLFATPLLLHMRERWSRWRRSR